MLEFNNPFPIAEQISIESLFGTGGLHLPVISALFNKTVKLDVAENSASPNSLEIRVSETGSRIHRSAKLGLNLEINLDAFAANHGLSSNLRQTEDEPAYLWITNGISGHSNSFSAEIKPTEAGRVLQISESFNLDSVLACDSSREDSHDVKFEQYAPEIKQFVFRTDTLLRSLLAEESLLLTPGADPKFFFLDQRMAIGSYSASLPNEHMRVDTILGELEVPVSADLMKVVSDKNDDRLQFCFRYEQAHELISALDFSVSGLIAAEKLNFDDQTQGFFPFTAIQSESDSLEFLVSVPLRDQNGDQPFFPTYAVTAAVQQIANEVIELIARHVSHFHPGCSEAVESLAFLQKLKRDTPFLPLNFNELAAELDIDLETSETGLISAGLDFTFAGTQTDYELSDQAECIRESVLADFGKLRGAINLDYRFVETSEQDDYSGERIGRWTFTFDQALIDNSDSEFTINRVLLEHYLEMKFDLKEDNYLA